MVIKPSTFFISSSISMAPKQNTTQQKKPKTNLLLTCFGFSSKKSTSSSINKKPKKSGSGRRKLFKLSWPKLKVIVIEKKNIILDPKTAALKASHDIMVQATKVHQLKLIDHKVKNSQEPLLISHGSNDHQDNETRLRSQSYCATCHHNDKNPSTTPRSAKCFIFSDKVSKDSLIGVSIMVAMLIIMAIWGKLCAILFMSAWLYCIPIFRPANKVVIQNHTEKKLHIDDMNTELYKKKVVLQGLLQRDHKNAIGIS